MDAWNRFETIQLDPRGDRLSTSGGEGVYDDGWPSRLPVDEVPPIRRAPDVTLHCETAAAPQLHIGRVCHFSIRILREGLRERFPPPRAQSWRRGLLLFSPSAFRGLIPPLQLACARLLYFWPLVPWTLRLEPVYGYRIRSTSD